MNLNKIVLCLSISIFSFSMMSASIADDQTVNEQKECVFTREEAKQIICDKFERNDVIGIGEYDERLIEVKIPDNFTAIADEAFQSAYFLKKVHIPGSIKIIGDYAFNWCHNMSELIIDDGVEHIGEAAFSVCEDLENVVIPDSVKTIGETAFCACKYMENVTLGKGIEAIGDGAFFNCYNLKSIKVHSEDVKQLVINSFMYLTEFEELAAEYKSQLEHIKKVIEVIK